MIGYQYLKNFQRVNLFSALLYLFIFVYPLLWIWQGLDFTDTGFWLTNYSLIFTHPETVTTGFLCYLSEIIGGVWIALWGKSGLIGARFGYVLVLYLTIAAVYYALRDEFEKQHLLFSLFVALVFITRQDHMIIGYNNLTALFYAIAGGLLYKGIKEEKTILLFFAGAAAVLNIFVRMPNIVGVCLFLIPLFYNPKKSAVVKFLRPSLWGGFAGFTIIFFIMWVFGHVHIYKSELAGLFAIFQHEGSLHSGESLFFMFFKDHKTALNHGLFICGLYAAGFCFFLTLKKFENRIFIRAAGIVLGAAAGWYLYQCGPWIKAAAGPWLVQDRWTYTGVLYIFLIAAWFLWARHGSSKKLLLLISFATLVLTPLGSGNGIKNSVFGMWFAIPVVVSFLLETGKYNPANTALITLVFLFAVTSVWSYTYRDSLNRMEMTCSVNHPALTGAYTTRQRAEVVQQLLDELPAHVNKGEKLLAVESIPLIHYLTGTRPFLNTSWPMNLLPGKLESQMRVAGKSRKHLPPVVKATLNTRHHSWPENKDNGLFSNDPVLFEKRKIISNFVESHGYRRVWRNAGFEIWLPRKGSTTEKFYTYDYTMEDFAGKCGNLQPILAMDWMKLGQNKIMNSKKFKKEANPFAAIQGIRGEFVFHVKSSPGDKNILQISPRIQDETKEKSVLQAGPWVNKKLLRNMLKQGNIVIFHIRARSISEKEVVIFVQDRTKDRTKGWEAQIGELPVFGNGKWQERVVFKPIRSDAKDILAGIRWHPSAGPDFLEIETMELFVCNSPLNLVKE
jgi:hypothetical protein